jgi:hypothetical protein
MRYEDDGRDILASVIGPPGHCESDASTMQMRALPLSVGSGDPPRSIQKSGAQHLLQLPDLPGERRLGDVQLGRRADEAAVIGDGDEVAGVAQGHKHCLSDPLVLGLGRYARQSADIPAERLIGAKS